VPLSANGKVDRSALRVEELADRVAIDRPPVTELEKTLAGFFAELLQRETVRCGASFFELGGNSLLAVQLVGKIRARFGREVPLSALFEHQSVERLARALEARVAAPTRTPLVAIQARGARPPLFCVHPVGGNVGCYVPLARELGESIPLWGIQAVSSDDEELTIAGLARRYVAAIREREARGPYRLAGWSMGGVIAYEMAQQLHAAGERVASLVLIDVGQEPAPRSKRRPSDADLLAWFERDLLRLTGATAAVGAAPDPAGPGGSPISRVRDRLVAAGALPAELGADEVGAWFERFTGNMRALVGYRATRYPGPLWFARGTEGASRAVADAWARRSAVGEVIDLPGDHYTVMQEAGALAGAIRRALREGESRPVARALASSEPKTRPASYQEGEGGR
jgi:thioesterase domain-containing protein/acyl carrier protein